MKKPYSPPELTVWGSLIELTHAAFNLDGFALRGGSVPTITRWTEDLADERKRYWEEHHWVDPEADV